MSFSLIRAAMAKLSEFNPQNLANTVWAFAQSGNRAPELFAAVSKAAQSKLHMMNPQELANTAWAYATAQEVAPALFNAIEQAVPRKLSEFNAQNLADSAWAFARTNLRPRRMSWRPALVEPSASCSGKPR